MYNAINRITSLIPAVAVSAMFIFSGCSGSDNAGAQDLKKQAEALMDKGDYAGALTLMDSINRAYPEQIQTRREILKMRAAARTAIIEKQLADADSIINECETELQTLAPQMLTVRDGDSQNYYVLSGAHSDNFLSNDAVEARVAVKDLSYTIVANNAGSKIGVNRIVISTDNGDIASATIPEGDARCGDIDKYGTDLATFAPSEVDDLGRTIFESGARVKGATISGSKGSKNIALSGARAEQFGKTWRFAMLSRKLHQAKMLRDKLERDIVIARDHEANLVTDSI